ncbi:MAG: hypothetical protein KDC44_06140, partial [Phaeodactylibacter sp.]|nr:hypothetical protein [Phaeodactylibacter sp.]
MKKDLFSYIKQLFQAAEESSPSVPVLHEVLELSPAEQEDFEQWSKNLVRRRLTDWLHEQYVIYSKH